MYQQRYSIARQRALVIFGVVLVLTCVPMAATSHPLGNFTINHFTKLQIGREEIRVRYIIDMAEIPSYQEIQRITSAERSPSKAELDAYLERVATGYASELLLSVDDRPLTLKLLKANVNLLAGVGNMQTLRIECDLVALVTAGSAAIARLRFRDNNYSDHIGWRELAVAALPGIAIFNSSVYGNAITDELRNYPADLLTAPLDERSADLSFTVGPPPFGARPLLTRNGTPAIAPRQDRLLELIGVQHLTPGVMLLGLLTAILLGGLHAMSPGHGKTVVAAYLVGSRGTVRHAGFLGLTVTVTHTAGVFALGIATLLASEYISPERLFPPLSLISGLIVATMGFSLLNQRLRAAISRSLPIGAHSHNGVPHSHDHPEGLHTHDHENDHDTHHPHQHSEDGAHSHGAGEHSHLPPGADGSPVTWRSLLALGISGGLLPCPSALLVLLAAITGRRVGYGLLLVVAFSLGLASVLTLIGIAFVYAGRLVKPSGKFDRLARLLPVVSAFVIACVGMVICYGALDQAGFFG